MSSSSSLSEAKKKKSSSIGTPSKNELAKMQKHALDYNKKHPHSLPPMLKKDAGNVELNNDRFNHSVDFSRIKADTITNPFIGDATDSEVAAATGGEGDSQSSFGGDSGAGGGEVLSISQAWEQLNEAEDLDEMNLAGLIDKAKGFAGVAKQAASDFSQKAKTAAVKASDAVKTAATAPANGILYYGEKGNIIRTEPVSETVIDQDADTLKDRMMSQVKILGGKSKAELYRGGRLIFSTAEGGSEVKSLVVVQYQTSPEGDKETVARYDGIKYASDKFMGAKKGKILDISMITPTPKNNQDVYKNLVIYAENHSKDNIDVSFQVLINGNKLALDTANLGRTKIGKELSNDAKIKNYLNNSTQKPTKSNSSYAYVVIKVSESKNKASFTVASSGTFESGQQITSKTKISSIPELKDIATFYNNDSVPIMVEVYLVGTKSPITTYYLGSKQTSEIRYSAGKLQSGHLAYDLNSNKFSNGKKSYTKGESVTDSEPSAQEPSKKETDSPKKVPKTISSEDKKQKIKSITGDKLDDATIEKIIKAIK